MEGLHPQVLVARRCSGLHGMIRWQAADREVLVRSRHDEDCTAEDRLLVLVRQHWWSKHLGLATHGSRHVYSATSRTSTLPCSLRISRSTRPCAPTLSTAGSRAGSRAGTRRARPSSCPRCSRLFFLEKKSEAAALADSSPCQGGAGGWGRTIVRMTLSCSVRGCVGRCTWRHGMQYSPCRRQLPHLTAKPAAPAHLGAAVSRRCAAGSGTLQEHIGCPCCAGHPLVCGAGGEVQAAAQLLLQCRRLQAGACLGQDGRGMSREGTKQRCSPDSRWRESTLPSCG